MGGAKIDLATDFRDLLRAFVDHDVRDLTPRDLAHPGVVFQIGLPPLRIDVLTQISGVDFATAWPRRQEALFDDVQVAVLGRDDFIANKRATGRLKDLADAERLAHQGRRRRKGSTHR